MQQLTSATRLKLMVPVIYFLAANLFFVLLFDVAATAYQLPGLILANVAFVLWIIARVQLGNAFSMAPKSKFLVKTGIYSKLRHPVYYFSILAIIGISLFIWSIYAWIAVIAVVILEAVRIRKEELLLKQTFGEEYVNYKQETWF